jgi:hypothetical protein
MLKKASVLLVPALAFACSSADVTTPDKGGGGGTGKADGISASDDPNQLIDNATFRFGDVVNTGDVGVLYGTDDDHIPYPDTYWAFVNEGVDWDWTGSGSPVDKYMSIADPDHTADAKAWEHTNHGNGVPGVADWFGHCPGWTAASMLNAPIQHAVDAKSDGNGGITSCNAGDTGCVHFEIGDINALMAEVYVDATSKFIGGRCDTKASDIQRDSSGRIVRNGGGCQGLNAGALMVVMANVMGYQQKAFAIDAQNDANTDQIWNQPAYRYMVNRFETLTEAEAANLVVHGTKDGDQTHYQWNDAAKGWALVDVSLSWVSEHGPNPDVYSGADSTRTTRMVAVIELDDVSSNLDSKVIGGEYVDDPSVGADRLTVPPFVWMATDAGPEDVPTWANGNSHNPYLKPSLVKQLIALGQAQ